MTTTPKQPAPQQPQSPAAGSDAIAKPQAAKPPAPEAPKEDLVTLTIDGVEVSVPKGTLIIRAAEEIGVQITSVRAESDIETFGEGSNNIVVVSTA